MQRWIRFFGIMACWLLIALPVLRGQEEPSFESAGKEPEKPRRKQPGFFHHAAKDTPLAQLQHADLLRAAGKTRKALRQYDALVHTWPITPEAAVAQRAYATLLMDAGRYQDAFDEFQYLIDNYTGRFAYAEILDQQLRIANHMRTARQGGFLFFPGTVAPERALPLLEKIIQNAPGWEKAADAQFQIAQIHEQNREYDLAVNAYEMMQLRHSGSPLAAQASFRQARCLCLRSADSPRDEELARRSLSALAAYVRDYPGDASVAEAQQYAEELKGRLAAAYFDRAVYYDRIARRPEAAVIAYRDFIARFPASPLKGKAEERVQDLEAGQPEIRHEK